jgi:hypothetical protein
MSANLDTFSAARAMFVVDASGNQISTFTPSATATVRLLTAAASDNPTLVKSSAGTVTQVSGLSAAAGTRFLKMYDKATTPASTDTPRMTYPIPAGSAFVFDCRDSYANGIGFRITTGVADNDTGALTSGDIVALNVDYF